MIRILQNKYAYTMYTGRYLLYIIERIVDVPVMLILGLDLK